MTSQIEQARQIARRAHPGQVDTIGAPYVQHPAMDVALIRKPEVAPEDYYAILRPHPVALRDAATNEGSL